MKSNLKKQVKRMLLGASSTDCPEERLALAVILKAVDDIGAKADWRHVVRDVSMDSTPCIKQGGLDFWLESVSIDKAYFHRILRMTGLLSHGLV